jgi:hypothetical protein
MFGISSGRSDKVLQTIMDAPEECSMLILSNDSENLVDAIFVGSIQNLSIDSGM